MKLSIVCNITISNLLWWAAAGQLDGSVPCRVHLRGFLSPQIPQHASKEWGAVSFQGFGDISWSCPLEHTSQLYRTINKLIPFKLVSQKGIRSIRLLRAEKTTKMWWNIHLFRIIANLLKSYHVLDVFSVLGNRIDLISFWECKASWGTSLDTQQQGNRSNLKIKYFKIWPPLRDPLTMLIFFLIIVSEVLIYMPQT